MKQHSRRAGTTFRGSAALLACAQLALPLWSAQHAAQAAHVACAEHGELLEADAPAVNVEPGAESATSLQAAPTAAEHAHVHCALLSLARERALPGVAAQAASVVGSPQAAPPRLSCAAHAPAIALIRLAPKSSPPARG